MVKQQRENWDLVKVNYNSLDLSLQLQCVVIFPRRKQRPSHFFRTDKDRIIVGPAAVEMGGILILPKKENFDSVSSKIIAVIYDEVMVSPACFRQIKESIVG